MSLVATNIGTSEHTGSTVVGPVAGTLTAGSNAFVFIEGNLVMIEDGKMVIPSHQYIVEPPAFHSHEFSPDNIQNNYFFIEGKLVITVGDNYSADATEVKTAGQNFVWVN